MKAGKHTFSRRVSAIFSTALLAVSVTASDADLSKWGYAGANGPDHWHQISSANALCKQGKQQSPINISDTDPAIMHRLETDYQVAPIHAKNDPHGISISYPKGSYLLVNTKRFELQQFHFHTPAEHTVAGERHPMSIHFVHTAPDGSLAVVGTFVTEGAVNLAAQELFEQLPLEPGQATEKSKILINARDLMPSDKAYYRYIGSLTTPPCSEGVNWYLLKKPVEFSKEQIGLIRGLVGGNNARPLQTRNNRLILDARVQ